MGGKRRSGSVCFSAAGARESPRPRVSARRARVARPRGARVAYGASGVSVRRLRLGLDGVGAPRCAAHSDPEGPVRNVAPGARRTRRSGRGPDAPRTAPGRAPDQPRTRPDARRTRRTAPDFAGRKSQDVRRTRPGRSRAPPDAAGRGRTPSAGRGPDRAGPAPDAGAKIPDAPDAPDAPGRAGRRRTLPDAPGRGSRTRRTRPPDAAPGREPDAPRTPG